MAPTPPSAADRMTAEQSAVLADFARACKAAARSVSLYPATHPSIQASLSRVAASAGRLTPGSDVMLTVHPDVLLIDGRSPARPDPAIGELAALLHDRLIGELRIERSVDLADWHALLLILARPAEELIAEGGPSKAWAASGRGHFEIGEIDYAEVLRERAGSGSAEWDRIIAYCLQGDAASLDERALAALLTTMGDPERFGDLVHRLDEAGAAAGASVGARTAALLQLVQRLVDAAGTTKADAVLDTAAASISRLTPEMVLDLVSQARAERGEGLAANVVEHIKENTVASFVAGSVAAERRATERLAQAFEALVPQNDSKERLLDLAKQEAQQGPLGSDAGFENLWESVASMLTSYSDESFVSAQYARELSDARLQAVDVERVYDDPPERVEAWLSTVDNQALRQLDLMLLVDLLRIESDAKAWRELATVVVSEVERRTLLGEIADAQQLTEGVVRELGPEGRASLRPAAESAIETLTSGSLVRHLVVQLRKVSDSDVEPLNLLAHTIGPRVIKPMAEALAVEENNRSIRRLRELLLGFGAAGRQSAEQLKQSSNPAVRRTAIDLLRVFGGREALPELASMLDDADPQVQRESIRAIVQIGTPDAHAVLERAILASKASRDTILQELIGLRDDKAIPLLCYVLNNTRPRGKLVQAHLNILEALGNLSTSPASTQALKGALYHGEWWAPFRTRALRQAAATALKRIASADAVAVLEEAGRTGNRGVRSIARAQGTVAVRRERERT